MEMWIKIIEFFVFTTSIVISLRLIKKLTGIDLYKSLGALGKGAEILGEATEKGAKKTKDFVRKRGQENRRRNREGKQSEQVQMRFGDQKSRDAYKRPSPKKDTSDREYKFQDESGTVAFNSDFPSYELKDNAKKPERDFNRSHGRKIKTFDEFVRPDKLQLDLENGSQMIYDLDRQKFIVDKVEYGAGIYGVTGLEYVGKSRVDGHSLVRIKCGVDKPILVKVNQNENRFELVKSLEDHISGHHDPQASNIDDWMTSNNYERIQTRNGKIIRGNR